MDELDRTTIMGYLFAFEIQGLKVSSGAIPFLGTLYRDSRVRHCCSELNFIGILAGEVHVYDRRILVY